MSQKIAILTSWNLNNMMGSGVSILIKQTESLFLNDGVSRVKVIHSNLQSQNFIILHLGRIFFNLKHRLIGFKRHYSYVFGFDFDGFSIKKNRNFLFISHNGGILKDVVKFQTGMIKGMLIFLAYLEKIALQRSDKVVVPSRFCQRVICRQYGIPMTKIVVIPPSFDLTAWKKMQSKAKKILSKEKIILTVAKLYKRKNIELLIEAFALVLKHEPGCKLWIVGDGLNAKSLRNLCRSLGFSQKKVLFWGEVLSRKRMTQIYKSCDIFCLSSLHETFGLVFLEAMASKKPIVATNLTAIPEVIQHQKTALLSPATSNVFASRILTLLKNKSVVKRLTTLAYQQLKFYHPNRIRLLYENHIFGVKK